MTRPPAHSYAPFYAAYLDAVGDGDVLALLEAQPEAWRRLLRGADGSHAYAPGKWTVGEVVQHVVDTERVFAYRALRFARGDEAPLPGFDQDAWVPAAPAQPLDQALDEMAAVRTATLALVRSLPDEALDRAGAASGHAMTARAAVWVIAGHTQHHGRILRERYGLDPA